jgi:hypothetical protein
VTQLDRDEALIESTIAERQESLRAVLDPELRDEIAVEEEELAGLLQRIIERRARLGPARRGLDIPGGGLRSAARRESGAPQVGRGWHAATVPPSSRVLRGPSR